MQERTKKWLALSEIPDLGAVGIKKLWDHFGSIEKIWQATYEELAQIEGLSKKAAASLLNNKDKKDNEIQLPTNISILTLEDEGYPENLKNIYDPPPVLYLKGEITPPDQKALAIVGTRSASNYGKETARKLAFQLAKAGLTIVSGMALGIDSAAHEGSLEAKGRTLAVFGCG